MKRSAIAAAVGGTALLVGVLPGVFVLAMGNEAPGPLTAPVVASGEIPPAMLAMYQATTVCPGLPWQVLAGVGKVESDHGRSTLLGVHDGTNDAGAAGPMQLLAATWAAYGGDGNGDGTANIYDPADAIPAAARYLCANGAGRPEGVQAALARYNRESGYPADVLAWAGLYGASAGSDYPIGTAQALATNPRLTLTEQAKLDLSAGTVDPRIMAILAAMATEHTIQVGVFRTGHSEFVNGTTRQSNHFFGRAVDIGAIDGVAVSPAHPAVPGLVQWLRTLPDNVRPSEVGEPLPELAGGPVFEDEDHQAHLHIGFDR